MLQAMYKKLNVLFIDDSQTDVELMLILLEKADYNVTYRRVETAEEMFSALDSYKWDIILCDYVMPEFTVQGALEIFQQQETDIPFIVISGAIGEEKAVQLIKSGIHDYLPKGNLVRFIPIIERELREAYNRRELIKVNTELAISRAKIKSYLENAPDFVFVIDREGKFIEVNRADYKITGYTRDELLQMSFIDIFTEGSISLGKEQFAKLLETGSLNTNFRVQHKNGSMRTFAINAVQLALTMFLGFINDITAEENAIAEVIRGRKEMQLLNQYLMEARENERAAVAMEIHDELGQSLTGLKIDLNWVRDHIADVAAAKEKIAGTIRMTDEIIKKVQRISAELRPGLLDDLGLASAIEWYCGEYEERTGIKCKLQLDDFPENEKRISIALFRIFQEALTNVIRHARASNVVVILKDTAEGISLVIEDDGLGIQQDKISNGKSLGLIGMRERARQINGSVEFIRKPVSGTMIVAMVPALKTEPFLP